MQLSDDKPILSNLKSESDYIAAIFNVINSNQSDSQIINDVGDIALYYKAKANISGSQNN